MSSHHPTPPSLACSPLRPFRQRVFRHGFGYLSALLALFAPAPAFSCSLALVLALDVSASVDDREYRQQLNGLADALQDPEVVQAIEAVGGIWATGFEWSGTHQQLVQLKWAHLTDAESAQRAASILRRAQRSYTEFPTALGYALGFASVQLRKAPEPCSRKVVDVAGDGINNDGFTPASAYRAFDFVGVTVNGLVVAGADTTPVQYYFDNVIRGPGAFVETAATYADYSGAMKRKLLREIFGNGYADLR